MSGGEVIDLADYGVTAAEFLATLFNTTGEADYDKVGAAIRGVEKRIQNEEASPNLLEAFTAEQARVAEVKGYNKFDIMTVEGAEQLIKQAKNRFGRIIGKGDLDDYLCDEGIHIGKIRGRNIDLTMRFSTMRKDHVFIDVNPFMERTRSSKGRWNSSLLETPMQVIKKVLDDRRRGEFVDLAIKELERRVNGADRNE